MKKPNFIFTKNLNSEYLGANQSFAELVGLNASNDIVGKNDFDFHWGKSHANLYRERDKQVFNGLPLINLIEDHPLESGELIAVTVNKIPIYNAASDIIGLTCHYDIHERQNMPALTAIQTNCLRYLALGLTAKKIAQSMRLSHRTVEFYISILKMKLNCDNKAQLISKALRLGICQVS